MVFYSIELLLILAFGFVYYQQDQGKARPLPVEVKVVPKRAEKDHHFQFDDSDETTSPSTELNQ